MIEYDLTCAFGALPEEHQEAVRRYVEAQHRARYAGDLVVAMVRGRADCLRSDLVRLLDEEIVRNEELLAAIPASIEARRAVREWLLHGGADGGAA